MSVLGVVGLLLGIAALIVLSYKGVNAFVSSLIAAAIVIITNGMPFWGTFSDSYATGMKNFCRKLFPDLRSGRSIRRTDEDQRRCRIGCHPAVQAVRYQMGAGSLHRCYAADGNGRYLCFRYRICSMPHRRSHVP